MRALAPIAVAATLAATGASASEPEPTGPEEYVLIDCDATLRAGVMERSSTFAVPSERCSEDTGGAGAWQVRLLAVQGDLLKVETLGAGWARANTCSDGPRGLRPMQLTLYAPSDALVRTVAEATTVQARDGRAVQLRTGVPLQKVKGRWHAVAVDGERVEVAVAAKATVDRFEAPPRGPCAEWVEQEPVQAERQRSWIGTADQQGVYEVPAGSTVYLPTREAVGTVWNEFELLQERSFTQGMLRCHTVAAFDWALGGSAPLCFLEIALTPKTIGVPTVEVNGLFGGGEEESP